MKKIFFVFICIVVCTASFAQAGDVWVQKNDVAWNAPNGPTARWQAVGFSIGDKGYIGMGLDSSYIPRKDFWEYDTSANAWTQKADFGGEGRSHAVGFSIGSKGYVGTGFSYPTYYDDIWEYDPSVNTWTQKADFGGEGRESAVGFSIGTKGYIGTGSNGSGYFSDFWEYDPSSDNWIRKADFAGSARGEAVGLSIRKKGYIGTGTHYPAYYKDFWEYDPSANTWTQKADFGSVARSNAVGFSLGATGFIGTGSYTDEYFFTYDLSDFWEYDPSSDTWKQKASVPGSRERAIAFSIGTRGFIGMGINTQLYFPPPYNDLLEYTPSTNEWTHKANLGGIYCAAAPCFSIGTKGYIETASGPGSNFWEYDPATSAWTQKADFSGTGIGVGFSIGTKGYIGTSYNNEFWEYDPLANVWTSKADFAGAARWNAAGFSIGTKGYIGTGANGDYPNYNYLKDFWEYDPSTDAWTQRADFGGEGRSSAVGFSIGVKGYIGTGSSYPTCYKDFWEYDPSADAWSKKANFSGLSRSSAVGFSIGTKGYIGTGYSCLDATYYNDFWEYDPSTNAWTRRADFSGLARSQAAGFSIGSKGYVGTGVNPYKLKDFWEYTPESSLPVSLLSFNGSVQKSDIILNWQTVNETNAAYFALQRSPNGLEFSTINKINAAGNSTVVRSYSYTDINAVKLINAKTLYYRLQPTDKDGKMTTSKIVAIDLNKGTDNLFVFPNPFRSFVTLQFNAQEIRPYQLLVTDISGKNIIIKSGNTVAGNNTVELNMVKYASGSYLVKLTIGNVTKTIKLNKE